VSGEKHIIFGDFRLDLVNECLWRGGASIALAPKEYAVLLYLARHPGRLVTKEELIEAVWPETVVTDGVLKVSIRKIRIALDDDPKTPQYIETSHRRGYRFIGRIVDEAEKERGNKEARRQEGKQGREDKEIRKLGSERLKEPGDAETRPLSLSHLPLISPSSPTLSAPLFLSGAHRFLSGVHRAASLTPPKEIVGRETPLARMQGWLRRAMGGERQVAFITGEAGIGKTTLIEAFLRKVARDPNTWIGQGQCLEQYGAGEAYLPVLEAVSRLCQEPGRERLVDLLRRRAPTWLQQMPWLIGDAERESLQREVIGATRERMLREMAEALEALTAETPLALVLEDLHWSDFSTLDLVSYLARRRKPARLLIIATYRPVEVAVSEHPLKGVKQDLQAHRLCEELPLEYLSEKAVGEYLAARYPRREFPAAFAAMLHARTEGNPFFLVNAVDYLQAEGLIMEKDGQWRLTSALAELGVGVPENIRQMIEKQIERLDREQQRLLEIAAVAGAEFPAAAISIGMEKDLMWVEEQCEELERRHQFLISTGAGMLPNGVMTARYGFIHALYQEVLYRRVAPGRRVRLHLLIGERGEEAYGDRAGEVAAELAMHFEEGRDYKRAVKYLRLAAQNHFQRYANREAIAYLSRALKLMTRWPESATPEIHIATMEQAGLARLAMGDMAAAADDFASLADYARERGRTDEEVKALIQMATALSWVDRDRCLAAAERFMALSRGLSDELLRAHAQGCWAYWQALFLSWREEHVESLSLAVMAARRAGDREMAGLHLARRSFFECLRANYPTACRAAEDGAQLALEVSDAHSFLLARYYQAWGLLHLGKWGEMQRILCQGLEMAERNNHRRWEALYRLESAWLRAQAFDFEGSRELCEQAHEVAREIGHPYTESLSLILLGLSLLWLGRHKASFQCFSEVAERLDRERSLMDWILRLPLHYGLSRYWLAQGQPSQARREAERVCELAALPGERTYLALGLQTLAEVAMVEQSSGTASGPNFREAESSITKALAAIDGADAPLAQWRVCLTAAQLYERLGRAADAAHYWKRSAETLRQLDASLDSDDSLRDSLLADPTVQAIRRRAGAS
jgi:DNA-binding winged helix-turn-helix (wHTH) protein/tetratricopeptide (TPR) repeat protein